MDLPETVYMNSSYNFPIDFEQIFLSRIYIYLLPSTHTIRVTQLKEFYEGDDRMPDWTSGHGDYNSPIQPLTTLFCDIWLNPLSDKIGYLLSFAIKDCLLRVEIQTTH